MTTGKNLLVAVALVLFCSTCSAQWAGDAGTEPQQMIEPNPNSCECSDANPRDGVYYNVTYTCLQELGFGSCNKPFILNSVKELSEGYCQITCGRCSCCTSVADVLQSNNANSLIQAAQLAGMDKQLASPASMFTLLAPTDAAFTAALKKLNVANLESTPPATLEAILGYHIIPPHKFIDAVWTTPFFAASNGAKIDTALPDSPLTFSSRGNIEVTGDSNSATIVKPDVVACKSFINIIDAVLIPPPNARAAPLPVNAGSITAFVGGPITSAAAQVPAAPGAGIPKVTDAELLGPTSGSSEPGVASPESAAPGPNAGAGFTVTPNTPIGATAGR